MYELSVRLFLTYRIYQANNQAFEKELTEDKRKNSAEFLKFLFELGDQLCMIELHDYNMM